MARYRQLILVSSKNRSGVRYYRLKVTTSSGLRLMVKVDKFTGQLIPLHMVNKFSSGPMKKLEQGLAKRMVP